METATIPSSAAATSAGGMIGMPTTSGAAAALKTPLKRMAGTTTTANSALKPPSGASCSSSNTKKGVATVGPSSVGSHKNHNNIINNNSLSGKSNRSNATSRSASGGDAPQTAATIKFSPLLPISGRTGQGDDGAASAKAGAAASTGVGAGDNGSPGILSDTSSPLATSVLDYTTYQDDVKPLLSTTNPSSATMLDENLDALIDHDVSSSTESPTTLFNQLGLLPAASTASTLEEAALGSAAGDAEKQAAATLPGDKSEQDEPKLAAESPKGKSRTSTATISGDGVDDEQKVAPSSTEKKIPSGDSGTAAKGGEKERHVEANAQNQRDEDKREQQQPEATPTPSKEGPASALGTTSATAAQTVSKETPAPPATGNTSAKKNAVNASISNHGVADKFKAMSVHKQQHQQEQQVHNTRSRGKRSSATATSSSTTTAEEVDASPTRARARSNVVGAATTGKKKEKQPAANSTGRPKKHATTRARPKSYGGPSAASPKHDMPVLLVEVKGKELCRRCYQGPSFKKGHAFSCPKSAYFKEKTKQQKAKPGSCKASTKVPNTASSASSPKSSFSPSPSRTSATPKKRARSSISIPDNAALRELYASSSKSKKKQQGDVVQQGDKSSTKRSLVLLGEEESGPRATPVPAASSTVTEAASSTAPGGSDSKSPPGSAPTRRGARSTSILSTEWPWKKCNVHRPTLEELQQQSFSDYVRNVVLRNACFPAASFEAPSIGGSNNITDGSSNGEQNAAEGAGSSDAPTRVSARRRTPVVRDDDYHDLVDYSEIEMPLCQGIAKVVLPKELLASISNDAYEDQTGRIGAAWQDGGRLGNFEISNPIEQHLRGLAGIYEYTFTDQKRISVSQFRNKADAYRIEEVGSAFDDLPRDDEDEDAAKKREKRAAHLERLFWKRLGPTMPPAWYGADHEGSFFTDPREDDSDSDGDDSAVGPAVDYENIFAEEEEDKKIRLHGWSLRHMDSCLNVLSSQLPGVTTPYLYFGMWAACFAIHTEDMNLLSINYLHAGAPKIWYAVAPQDAPRLEALATHHYIHAAKLCKDFLRHKRCMLSPQVLKKAGIPFTTTVQYPGEAVITMPNGFHFGFNTGFNVAEATNLAVPEWVPFGRKASVCNCRPDSVRIDIDRFQHLLRQYNKEQKGKRRGARLTWKEWSQKREVEEEERERRQEEQAAKKKQRIMEGQVDVALSDQQRKNEFWVEVMKPIGSSGTSPSSKKGGKKKGGHKMNAQVREAEIWHLAKPVGRRKLKVDMNVLVLLPATVMGAQRFGGGGDSSSDDDDDDEVGKDEQCFAGEISEFSEDHIRVHLTGLPRTEDVWVPIGSPKLFLDGGLWNDEETAAQQEVPDQHYWKIMDSKELVEK